VLLFLAGRFLNNYNYFPFYDKVCVVDPTNIAKAVLKEELEDTKGVIRIRSKVPSSIIYLRITQG
jgi:hypothetical protein